MALGRSLVIAVLWAGGLVVAGATRADTADDARAGVIAAAVAVRGEDFAALQACVAMDDAQARLWQATLKQRAALRELEQRTEGLGTGPLGDVGLSGLGEIETGALLPRQLKTAKVEVRGNAATVTEVSKDPPGTFMHEMLRVDGRWKLVRAAGAGGRDVAAVVKKRERDTAEIRRIVNGVRAGEYISRAGVQDAVHEALERPGGEGQVMMIGRRIAPARLEAGAGTAVFPDWGGIAPKREAREFTMVLLDQLTYEQRMVGAASEVAVRVAGEDAARGKRLAAAEETYQAEWMALRTKRLGEMVAATGAAKENQEAMALTGGNVNPDLLVANLRPHAALFGEMLEISRRYRRAMEEILTPEQRRAWNASVVRTRMQRKLAGRAPVGAGKEAFEGAVAEAAGKVAELTEPRDFMAVDAVIDGVWEANRARITGTP